MKPINWSKLLCSGLIQSLFFLIFIQELLRQAAVPTSSSCTAAQAREIMLSIRHLQMILAVMEPMTRAWMISPMNTSEITTYVKGALNVLHWTFVFHPCLTLIQTYALFLQPVYIFKQCPFNPFLTLVKDFLD